MLATMESREAGQALREQLLAVAREVGRLGAASRLLESCGADRLALEASRDAMAAARECIEECHSCLREDRGDDAQGALEGLKAARDRLREAITDGNSSLDQDRFVQALRNGAGLTPDTLCHAVEFYSGLRDEPASRARLVAVAAAFALDEAGPRPDLPTLAECFLRRGLLAGETQGSIPAALAARVRELSQAIEAASRQPAEAQERVRAEVRDFESEVAGSLGTVGGLAAAVAVRLAVEEAGLLPAATAIDGSRTVELPVADLDLMPEDMSDDDAAAELVSTARDSIKELATGSDDSSRDLALEAGEIDAILIELAGEECDRGSVLEASACRLAVDRLARRLATGPAGRSAITAEDRAAARSLLRQATEAEADLNAAVQSAVIRSSTAVAKSLTRLSHRLARARLGLALLADLPPDGLGTSVEAPKHDQTGEIDVEALQSRLEAANLFRSALRGDSSSSDAPTVNARLAAPGAELHDRGQLGTRRGRLKRVQLRQVQILIGVGLLTAAFHIFRLAGSSESKDPFKSFQPPMQLENPIQAEGTFVASVGCDWPGLGPEERAEKVQRLWSDVRGRGFHRMMLLDQTSRLPLAYVSDLETRILPDSGIAAPPAAPPGGP